LAEIPDYYTKLASMEQGAKSFESVVDGACGGLPKKAKEPDAYYGTARKVQKAMGKKESETTEQGVIEALLSGDLSAQDAVEEQSKRKSG